MLGSGREAICHEAICDRPRCSCSLCCHELGLGLELDGREAICCEAIVVKACVVKPFVIVRLVLRCCRCLWRGLAGKLPVLKPAAVKPFVVKPFVILRTATGRAVSAPRICHEVVLLDDGLELALAKWRRRDRLVLPALEMECRP